MLRQKIMSSFISSSTQNLFIFAVVIHMVVLIDNQALINIHIYYFSHFSMFLAMFQLRKYLCGKIVKAKDHVQFYIKFNSESFQICYTASLYHTHQYVGAFKLIYFLISSFFVFYHCYYLEKCGLGKMLKFKIKSYFQSSSHQNFFKFSTVIHCIIHTNM